MTVEQHTPVNPVATAQLKPTSEFHELQQQIPELTAQVAALTTRQTSSRIAPAFRQNRSLRCFICNRAGHLQYNRPTRRDSRFWFTCGQQGHGWRTCLQGNGQGVAAWGNGHPRQ